MIALAVAFPLVQGRPWTGIIGVNFCTSMGRESMSLWVGVPSRIDTRAARVFHVGFCK